MNTFIYIILIVIGVFFGLQYLLVLKSKLNRGKSIDDVNGPVGDAIKDGKKVMVYFHSPTCPPCRVQTPIVDKLKKEFDNIFKVDTSTDFGTARRFGVMGTPSTVIVSNGKIEQFLVGVKDESTLRKYLIQAVKL
jgi:thioredoxin 1